jgi:hypothetical protein
MRVGYFIASTFLLPEIDSLKQMDFFLKSRAKRGIPTHHKAADLERNRVGFSLRCRKLFTL